MGADDQNEGHEPGECIEHTWVITGADLRGDGSVVEYGCRRCPAVSVETPADLRGS